MSHSKSVSWIDFLWFILIRHRLKKGHWCLQQFIQNNNKWGCMTQPRRSWKLDVKKLNESNFCSYVIGWSARCSSVLLSQSLNISGYSRYKVDLFIIIQHRFVWRSQVIVATFTHKNKHYIQMLEIVRDWLNR